MNKRKHFIVMSLASLGVISAFASVSAASLQAGTTTRMRDKAQTAIKEAFTTGDYQTYLAAVKDSKAPVLTEVQFNAMVQAQKLRASGDITGAKKVLSDAGVKPEVPAKKSTTKTTVKPVAKVAKAATTTKTTVHKAKMVKKSPVATTTVSTQ